MRASYVGLLSGLAFSIVLVYLLIVVNFQSWLDPFIMISALPAALAGIAWFLFITHTTLSVPALMGAIMCMGVATSNSILVVSFATEKMEQGSDSISAALEAGFTRFRPVLMTALAMIIGMVPMALGLGDGGEQNAPLGRAVIGGLIFATVSTLFLCPSIFQRSAGFAQTGSPNGVPTLSKICVESLCRNKLKRKNKPAGKRSCRTIREESQHPYRRWLVLIIAVVVVAALLVSGIVSRVRARTKLKAETAQVALTAVSVVSPKQTAPAEEIILPGNVQPFINSPVYARTNGYLKKWYFDIGAHVKKGQLLAVIETPEVDQQLQQARSNLSTAQANLELATITKTRYQGLLKTHAVSQQDADNAVGTYNANKAIVQADQAAVDQYAALVSFEKIYAPFDGVITARNTDIGDLINSGSSTGVKNRSLSHRSTRHVARLRKRPGRILARNQSGHDRRSCSR